MKPARYITLALCNLLPAVAAIADDAVLDFRTFIPGVVDAPVYHADGTTRLSGPKYGAQLWVGPDSNSLMPVGTPVPFGTNESAGYCCTGDQSAPIPVVLPFARPGDRVWIQMRAWEVYSGIIIWNPPPPRFLGSSFVISLVVSNTPTPLIGLKSFSFQPVSIQATRQSNQLVLRWSAGDGTAFYDVEVGSTLGSWRSSGMSPALQRHDFPGGSWKADWVLTNALSGPGTFYRVRLLNP